jgi:hypothetical protein
MRRKRNKANQNVIYSHSPANLPVGIVNQLKQPGGPPNGAKFVQIFIMIDEPLAAL